MRKSLIVSGLALAAALLTVLPAAALDINIGGVGGGSNSDTTATVNTGLLNTTGDDVNARVDLGGLNGSGGDPTTANVTLGGAGSANGDVLLDLFGTGAGSGSGSNARIALGNGGLGAGGGNDAVLNLFGPDAAGGAGASGDDGAGGNSNSGSISGNARTVGTVQIAAAGGALADGKCFSPNAEQEAKLVARHDYGQATVSWGQVSQLKVVDVGLCDGVGTDITSQSNIAHLQSYVSAHPEIRAGLDKLGRSPREVIAGDKAGGTLTLYVM